MKKSLCKLAVGISLTVGSSYIVSAQDTQIKFFGQPEFVYNSESKKGAPSAWSANPVFDPSSPKYDATAFPSANTPPTLFDEQVHDTTNSNFNTGKFVMFITSQLSEKISVLSENSAGIVNGQAQFEIERLLLRYYVKDYFSVRVGKMFNPLGYWNNQYNLGLVLQPTIQRPLVIRNSSDGGVLQIKDVGGQVEGDNITKLRLSYRLMVSNGIGFNGGNDKRTTGVAFTGAVGIEPIDGLKLLVSGRTAELYKGMPILTGTTPENGRQISTNFAVAYMNPEKKPEFIAEFYHSKNQLDNIGDRFSAGYFAYAGYKVTNKAIPYLQYSYSQAGTKNQADNYYVGRDGLLVNVKEIIVGFRYKISSNLVWKIEYAFSRDNYTYQNGIFQTMPIIPANSLFPGYPGFNYGSDKTGYVNNQSLRMQFAFAF